MKSTRGLLNNFRSLNKYAYHTEEQEKLSEKTKNKLLAYYQESIGLPPSLLNTTQHATSFLEERDKTIATVAGVTFQTLPEAQNLSTQLASLDTMLQNIGGRYHPDDLVWYLQGERTSAIQTLKTQQAADINAVKSSGLDDAAKEAAIKQLEGSQKKQLESFEKKFAESITGIQNAAQTERDRVAILAAFRENNEKMRQAIDRAARNNSADRVTVSITGSSAILKDLTFEQVAKEVANDFLSLTGRPLKVQKNEKGQYSVTMSFPSDSTLWNILDYSSWNYYRNSSNLAMLDFLAAANLLKLAGEKHPIIEITGGEKNPALALRLAQDAYAALRKVGYTDKDITIYVNGKKQTVEEIFAKNPSRLQAINADAKNEENARTSKTTDHTEIKQTLDRYRANLPPAPAPAPAPVSTGPSVSGGGGGGGS